ncbi:hypothetical protein [Spongiactinospora sp. 9N601]|uniref:hypothetical protein n=1 Tax=Spongiactinospora sp. 9N601 TaxID=3375149 RepID=UPI0037A19DC9
MLFHWVAAPSAIKAPLGRCAARAGPPFGAGPFQCTDRPTSRRNGVDTETGNVYTFLVVAGAMKTKVKVPAWAVRLRAAREAKEWGRTRLAHEMIAVAEPYTLPGVKSIVGSIRGHETGRHKPSDPYRPLYCQLYGIPDTDLFGGNRPSTEEPSEGTVTEDAKSGDDMERRTAMQILGAFIPSLTVPPLTETIFSEVNRAIGDREEFDLMDWEQVVCDHEIHNIVGAPRTNLGNFIADITEVGRILDRTPPGPSRSAYLRISAQLSMMFAGAVVEEPRLARDAHRAARRAADASGDRDLAVYIRAREAMHSYWQGQPAEIVVQMSDRAIRLADGRPSAGLAYAYQMRAHGLASLAAKRAGDPAEARQALNDLFDLFERLPDQVLREQMTYQGFPESKLRFSEAWVRSLIGDNTASYRAADAAIAAFPSQRVYAIANCRSMQALTLVRDGHITEGLDHALSTAPGLPVTPARRLITGHILDALPAQARKLPAAQELRALTAA